MDSNLQWRVTLICREVLLFAEIGHFFFDFEPYSI